MRDARIKMKDGRQLFGPIWVFNPQAGFLSLAGEAADYGNLNFNDIESAEQIIRINPNGTEESINLLTRAAQEGWKEADHDNQ